MAKELELFALLDDNGVVQELAVFSDEFVAYRDQGDWLPITDDDEDDDRLSGLHMMPAETSFIEDFDMAESSGGTLTKNDLA